MQPQIQAYILHVRQMAPLPEAYERELMARAHLDDSIAQLELAEGHLLLAAKIAAEYTIRKDMEYIGTLEEANVALLLATTQIPYSVDQFSPFAERFIRNSLDGLGET